MVSGGEDGTVRVWGLDGGAEREPLGRHAGGVLSVAVTPGGQVVSAGMDRTMWLWDVDGGGAREPLVGHDAEVWSVAVTPGGQVVSGGEDGTVRLWDLAGGEEREPLGRHDGRVGSVAVTPGGQVVSGGADGTVRVWDIPGGAPFTPPPPILDMQTRATSDAASSVDRLGFDHLVQALDEMLNHPQTGLPLAIAVTAPRGAGKSSVMRQLQERLRSNPDDGADRFRRTWYTVDFPAWKYEKSERLWAAVAKKMYEDPQKQMDHWWERLRFRLCLEWNRLGGWHYLANNLGLPLASGGLAAAGFFLTSSAPSIGLSVGGGSALALGAWGRFSGMVGNPFKRSMDAYAARPKFEEHLGFTVEAERDIEKLMHMLAPMQTEDAVKNGKVKKVKEKPKPERAIAIFVDDLDRCSGAHLVEVIEAVNQIFNSLNARCVFILGMDRQVVAASIDVAYKDMVQYLKRQGIPLADEYGYRYLSKIVQMSVSVSVSVPPATPDGLRNLLSEVTGSEVPELPAGEGSGETGQTAAGESRPAPVPQEAVAEMAAEMRARRMANPVEVGEAVQQLEAQAPEDDLRRRAIREAARAIRADLFNTDSEHVRIAEYSGLEHLDPNPRQVKRYDNAFRLQLHVASTSSDLDFRQEQLTALAKWVAIRLRWPELAEHLGLEPDLLVELENHAYGNGTPAPDPDLTVRFERWFQDKDLKEGADRPDHIHNAAGGDSAGGVPEGCIRDSRTTTPIDKRAPTEALFFVRQACHASRR